MLSNEVLGAVLGIDCKSNKVVGNMVIYNDHYKINIYELAHLCKEWAFDEHKIYLMSTLYARNIWVCSAQGNDPFMEAKKEPEAIFKATQWIYDEQTI